MNLKVQSSLKGFLFVLYIIGVFALAYILILALTVKQSDNRIIVGAPKEISGTSVSLVSYWNDDELVTDLIKTGVLPESKIKRDKTIWLTTINITNEKNIPVEVHISDFILKDTAGNEHKPAYEPYQSKTIAPHRSQELQVAFYIDKKGQPDQLIYTADKESSKSIIFHIRE